MENLSGKHILITSGPTRGYLDAVRYISNKSTGKLGATIAIEALNRGAFVTFVYGTDSITPDITLLNNDLSGRLTFIEIETIDELLAAIQKKLKDTSFDAIVHVMAVLDYTPAGHINGKLSSNNDKLTITLVKTQKIIKLIRQSWQNAFLVSFKLEVGLSKNDLIERAYTSLRENGTDLVVANNQNDIAGNKHVAYLINSDKKVEAICETRHDISNKLMDIISKQLTPLKV